MKKNDKIIALIVAAALLILAAAGVYLSARKSVSDELEKEKAAVSRVTEELQDLQLQRDELAELNKSSIMSMVLDDGPIYVIINLARRPVTSVVGGAPASVSAILLV